MYFFDWLIGHRGARPMIGHNGTGLLLMFSGWTSPHQPRIEVPVLLFRGTHDGQMRNGRRYPVGFT